MANTNIAAIQSAITTMQNWIAWANTQKEAEPGKMLTNKYDDFVRYQQLALQSAQDLLVIYTQKGIV